MATLEKFWFHFDNFSGSCYYNYMKNNIIRDLRKLSEYRTFGRKKAVFFIF